MEKTCLSGRAKPLEIAPIHSFTYLLHTYLLNVYYHLDTSLGVTVR